MPRSLATLIAALAVTIAVVHATAMPQDRSPQRRFRSGIEITSITATVTDGEGHLVTDLTRDAFDVYEDGVRQPVTQFTSERVPLSLGVLLDTSDSMFGQRIDDARAAVRRFLFELLAPTDEFFILAFNHAPRVLTHWTRTRGDIDHALDALRPSGGTAVYDAMLDALPLVQSRANQRAALLLISDGADTASTATIRELRSALHRSDAFVYAIAIDSPDRKAINARVNTTTLADITGETGGRTEVIHTSADLEAASARIANELNSQYVLGYASPHPGDGQFHSIRVKVTRPGCSVRARKGYVGGS